jgi:cytochrome c oxidase subunit 2
MNWFLAPSVSTFGPDIDRMYYIILAITGVIFVITEFLLIYFLVKYRTRPGHKAEYIEGSIKAEVIWTAVPAVIVVALGLMSAGLWADIKDPSRIPAGSYELILEGRQFEWEATYAGNDGVLETADDFTLLNQVNVPVNRPVTVHLRAEDVLHSFFLPDLRVKQDAVPGMSIPVWFEATETGEYTIGCAELCGLGHYTMEGLLVVQSESEFGQWESDQVAALAGGSPVEVTAALAAIPGSDGP